MAEIPPDIVSLVLGEAYYLRKVDFSGEHQPDRPTLRACARVNSTWRELAQSLLFKSVVCNSTFADSILRENHALLKHVRIIDFTTLDDENDSENFGTLLTLALDRCPSLYEIIWRGTGRGVLSNATLSDIRRLNMSVLSLRIHWSDGPSTDSPYRLFACFPALQFLSIAIVTNSFHHVESPRDDFLAGVPLFELRLAGVPDSTLPSILHSRSPLRILDVPSIWNRETLEAIRPHMGNLRSLRLKRLTEPELSLVKACTKLEELVVMIDHQSAPLPDSLPSYLKHLLIVVSWGPGTSFYTSFIPSVTRTVNQAGPLRSIRLRGPTWNLQEEDLLALKGACDDHGIEFVVKSFASWPDEMSVKTRSFPRRRSISNFALMN